MPCGGDWVSLVGRLAIDLATLLLSYYIGVWCLGRAPLRTDTGSGIRRNKASALGAFGYVLDSPSGAICARLLTYVRYDLRKIIIYILLLIILILFAVQSPTIPLIVWLAPLLAGVMLPLLEANALAYDGGGITMQVLAGVPGLDDRRGRAQVHMLLDMAFLLLMDLVCFLVSGYWRSASGLVNSGVLICLSLALLFSGLGYAQCFSALLIYPVPSLDRPFSSPQGRALAQSLIPGLELLVHACTMLPSAVAALVLFTQGDKNLIWILAPLALVNGLLVLTGGIHLGGWLFDRRQLAIIRSLDNLATLQAQN